MTKNLNKLEISELERLNKVASPAHWIPLDLSQALKKNEDIVLIVELRNKAGRLIDMAKQLLHTEKWYAIRLRQLRDLCEKHNLLTEFCNIVANGKENHTAPPTYQNIVNQLEYELEKYKKKEQDEMSKSDLKCHCGESGYYHCSALRNKIKEMRDIIQIILEADALKEHAYDRGDDDASIYDLCKAALKFPGDE